MRRTFREKVLHIVKVVVAWLLAYVVFGMIRFYGVVEFEEQGRIWSTDHSSYILQILIAAVITGILYGIVDLLIERPSFQRWSYWRVLVVKGVLHFSIIIITLSLILMGRVQAGSTGMDTLADEHFNILTNKSYQVFILFFIVTSWILNTYQEVNRKFGKGVLLEMLLGKYHRPLEADRIFMFIDLKSSVKIADTLGHVRYSYLLQDAYFDLNVVLDKYKAKVYQYVGDQAVLHWSYDDGLKNQNCVRCYFAFINRMEKNRRYYEQRYGFVPYFKAGGHCGRVTVAEVGVRKRSIAFHGDTVNTTSRIHDFCNKYKQRLLISSQLKELLPAAEDIELLPMGLEQIKGKGNPVPIFGVSLHKP